MGFLRSGVAIFAVASVASCAGSFGAPEGEPKGGGGGSGGSGGGGGSGDDARCISAAQPGATSFECGDYQYMVTAPTSCPDGGCGLIIDIHGATMTGEIEEEHSHLAALAVPRGFIVVQPTAVAPLYQWLPDDDAAVNGFVDEVIASYDVDPARVHVAGFSAGGYMAWRMICERPELFASAAPAAAAQDDACASPLGEDGARGCLLAEVGKPIDVDILYMHGTSDPLVDFTCGEAQVADATAAWQLGAPTPVTTGTAFDHQRYVGSGGQVFELITHDHSGGFLIGGHCYPGATVSGGLVDYGCDESEFVWGEKVVAFFEQN